MDSQIVTIDQFAIAMASIQEAIANFGQMIDGQQTQHWSDDRWTADPAGPSSRKCLVRYYSTATSSA